MTCLICYCYCYCYHDMASLATNSSCRSKCVTEGVDVCGVPLLVAPLGNCRSIGSVPAGSCPSAPDIPLHRNVLSQTRRSRLSRLFLQLRYHFCAEANMRYIISNNVQIMWIIIKYNDHACRWSVKFTMTLGLVMNEARSSSSSTYIGQLHRVSS